MASTARSVPAGENEGETRAASFLSRMEEGTDSAICGGGTRSVDETGLVVHTLADQSCAQGVVVAPSDTPNGFVRGGRFSSSSQDGIRHGVVGRDGDGRHGWNYERLVSTPPLAAAFEEFCRKALCHESALFLSAVCRCV